MPTKQFPTPMWCAVLGLVASACAAPSAPRDASDAKSSSEVAITRVDAEDERLQSALRERALAVLPACEAEASGGTTGHADVSVEIDAAGETVAGILHTTFRSPELLECFARALTGVKLPEHTSSRARIRLEGH